jgi:hypothetical protein
MTMNQLDVLEELIDDDPFIRFYPSFARYVQAWDEMGGERASKVPEDVVFDFYAEKLTPEEALHIWHTYDPIEQIMRCKESLSEG